MHNINSSVYPMVRSPQVVADTTAPFGSFVKNGYYTVGNEIYNHKIYALQAATEKNLAVQWHFNDEIFNNVNWQEKVPLSLSELYRIRAQQIRQKYEYVILCWSGGGDSSNILDTFILNDIHIDEVVVLWPVSQTQGRYTPNLSRDSENMNSEWDYSLKPRIQQLRATNPEIKITVQDYLVTPNDKEDSDDTVTVTEKHGYVTIQKFRSLDSIIEKASENKTVGVVLGVSPIDIVLLDKGYVGTYFNDLVLTGPKADYTARGCFRNIEYFYWSPELPEMIKKQGHIMIDYLNQFPEYRKVVPKLSIQNNLTMAWVNRGDSEKLRDLRKFLLYPTWSNQILQVNKPKDTHCYGEWYNWFYKNPHSLEYLTPWISAIESHQRLIDPKYFKIVNGCVAGYTEFRSKTHIIGKLNE